MANRLAQTRVGVLGSGEVGRRLAAGFASRGHHVMIGTRDADKPELQEWLAGEGAGVETGSFEQTAGQGELLVLAVLGNAAKEAIAQAGPENFTGKVVIDATNPLDFSASFPPKLSIGGEDSLGERVQRALPDAKVVKAFNTIGNLYFVDPSFSEGKPTMLIAGKRPGREADGRRRAGRLRLAGPCRHRRDRELTRARGDLHRMGQDRRRAGRLGSRLQAPGGLDVVADEIGQS
jgi:8-hydroxy-5-deazaflavin:NADPH oxidoreductase